METAFVTMKKVYLTGLAVLMLFMFLTPSSAFPDSSIYSQLTDTAPVVDGSIGVDEWTTEEEVFQHTLSGINYVTGESADADLEVTTLRDDTFIYFLIKAETDTTTGNFSLGMAFSNNPIKGMNSALDRKFAYWNTTTTQVYDLHFNVGEIPRGIQPGSDDLDADGFTAAYGEDGSQRFFEFAIPMNPSNTTSDVPIGEGTNIKIVINPFRNIYETGIGHGGIATDQLSITFEPRAFFQRPPAGMNTLTMVFVGLFALLVSSVSLVFIFSGRSDKLAKKVWVINTTEKMAQQSILQEIAYYNSNFLSMIFSFLLFMYSVVTFAYSFWAQWYVTVDGDASFVAYFITIPPLLLTALAIFDLGKRNENLQLRDKDERIKAGVDMNNSGKLWLIPTSFLVLVLFMLVFIGIDVIT